ncbi:MAG: SIMPL domain-containing protein [Alphaproteobacteria bacterium]|nr:SIMPL domain-containing protein [Alphaproteobacteria bacterium]
MNIRAIAAGSGLVIVAALAAAALIGPRQGISAPDGALPRLISVSGIGEVKTRPDMALINTGVTTEGATAQDALSKNNAAMAAVMNALKNAGVAEDDIQTSNFSVSPQYPPYQPNQTTSPRISGYQVSNQVAARVKDLAKLGPTLDALVRAGSNQISGISFDVNEPKPLLDNARKKAVEDARAKAELLAAAAGVSLGRVVQISESGGVIMPPMPMYRGAAMDKMESVPIAAGQQTLSANVSITYEIQ